MKFNQKIYRDYIVPASVPLFEVNVFYNGKKLLSGKKYLFFLKRKSCTADHLLVHS